MIRCRRCRRHRRRRLVRAATQSFVRRRRRGDGAESADRGRHRRRRTAGAALRRHLGSGLVLPHRLRHALHHGGHHRPGRTLGPVPLVAVRRLLSRQRPGRDAHLKKAKRNPSVFFSIFFFVCRFSFLCGSQGERHTPANRFPTVWGRSVHHLC